MHSLYGEDLAHVHDTGFAGLAQAAGALVRDRLRAAGHRGGTVVDLGCGAGTTLRVLADAGFAPVGIDLSAPLLARARRRVPEGAFVHGRIQDAEPPPCVGIVAAGEVLQYVSGGRAALDDLPALAARLREALRPGGVLLLDVARPGREPAGTREAVHTGEGWTLRLRVAERDGLLTRDVVVERARPGGGTRRSRERHVLRLAEPGAVAGVLAAAGFGVTRVGGYPGLPPVPGLEVLIAG